ncbi:SSI family serine proteinase inhibitor [Streptomyces sp. SP18CS02]|uniref:SSI family serine proteinase inhibitor n=1 Tax=Streptomyces sp. SP18CS02 TaxID=3002531 RepID=UPI002E7A988B|nr:SSI family serine proteinase inhibitor [Streptomyces sp. SP18CS02]MEE1755414.1 SSI family serine proteinase inhibitor [Streptomyces sp. SP18CS02]
MNLRAAVVAAVLVALTPVAPALAGPPAGDRGDTPDQGLFLTVSGADESWIRGVRLHCAPEPYGPHPDAKGACAALARVGGDLDRLAGRSRACTKRSEPVTVGADGTWKGRAVDWSRTYGNACLLDAATGPVFRF